MKTVIEMAQEAGAHPSHNPELYDIWSISDKALERFAELVRAEALAEQPAQQEPVAWGVDWGKAGDIPCVSIIKRLPGGGIEVVAVEYAPYSYTFPTAQRTWVPDAMTHNEGETAEYVAGWNDCREFMLRKRNPK